MKFDLKKLRPKKKTVVISLVAALACAAVFLNWRYQSGLAASAADAAATAAEYEAIEDRRLLGDVTEVSGDADDGTISLAAGMIESNEVSASAAAYFDETRLSRQRARDEAIGILESASVSGTNGASDAAKIDAAAEITSLARDTLTESRIEGLVTAKGYADCVAFVSDGGVNVVVAPPSGGMQTEDVARILDIVTGETDVPASGVKIVEAK